MFRCTNLVIFAFLVVNSSALGEPPAKTLYVPPRNSAIFTCKPPIGLGVTGPLRTLMQERFDTAQKCLYMQLIVYEVQSWGIGDFNPMMPMGQELIRAYCELDPTREERLTMLTNYYNLTKNFEIGAKKRFEAGSMRKADMLMITYNRLDAEIQLLQAKAAK